MEGRQREATGTISLGEADFIAGLVEARKLSTRVETGIANGASTLAICTALSQLQKNGHECRLYGADPCQYDGFNGSAIAALKRCGVDHLFELLEGPSHLMLPKLIERGIRVNFAFVDGWHIFDYTLIDVFLADKLLRAGGILAMHDL